MEPDPNKKRESIYLNRRDFLFYVAGVATGSALWGLSEILHLSLPPPETKPTPTSTPCLAPTQHTNPEIETVPRVTPTTGTSLVLSIDTMKMSRDTLLLTPEQILLLCQEVKKAGATHIAIGTPYDDFAYNYLKDWITAARNEGVDLKVWLRGNFSDWENWYLDKPHNPVVFPADHHRQFSTLLDKLHHDNLLKDGDIVSPCPEPENNKLIGTYWDHKDVLQQFIRDSYTNARKKLDSLGLSHVSVVFSYNADVAYDLPTALYNTLKIIGLDHYPAEDASEMQRRIQSFRDKFPDIDIWITETGAGMVDRQKITTQLEQAKYMEMLFQSMIAMKVSAINIWTLMGGDTALIEPKGGNSVTERSVYQVVSDNFHHLHPL